MAWTEAQIADLKRLWTAGHSTSQIGTILGVSKNAVIGKAHRLKLPARPSPFATRRHPRSRSGRPCRSKFARSNAGRPSSPRGEVMGHRRASGRLAIQARPISTSAVERQFRAGPMVPSTAPARTFPEGQINHRLPEFWAHVTPVTSARSAGRLH